MEVNNPAVIVGPESPLSPPRAIFASLNTNLNNPGRNEDPLFPRESFWYPSTA